MPDNINIPPFAANSCPALVVAAPSSGSGKTTVVAALARYFRNQGKKVRVFKTGPDFIDPCFLEFASGAPVYQLDLWMAGDQSEIALAHCRQLLAQAAVESDLILIEGVMGMFDGPCSSADIAAIFNIPVLAVIDAKAMAQTFGAIAHGLASYRDDIKMFGVVANRVGSANHAQMLEEALPKHLAFCGWLAKDQKIELPERHLGLVQAQELTDLNDRLNHAAELISQSFTEQGQQIPLPAAVDFTFPQALPAPELVTNVQSTPALTGKVIAIARDKSFSFIYQANLDFLRQQGAELVFFAPIDGDALPECNALYLPGGYPELNIEPLAANQALIQQIKQHIDAEKPALAECGGMIYLMQSLTTLATDNIAARTENLCGILDGKVAMQPKLAALGMVSLPALMSDDGQIPRGHTFHYSKTETDLPVWQQPVSLRGRKTDPVWKQKKLVASYVHWYFPSCPEFFVGLFGGMLVADSE
ncbi:cobyrinate a,c-diamide synthase [Pelagibaculum spongiae]|uniref:Cobyrinate a,c-diamide synthase n=1 Tax=Pelagibaculum spongiae TaxID=2080658 RepID=A0A2V1H4V4_9GAMM|nr:cobyrinate a,c-diamide synthase [Pelagibaculum spongiae]PVZ72258.1 cobyrinate a,c-diamide synthase [Pelagibaculum spongiae]